MSGAGANVLRPPVAVAGLLRHFFKIRLIALYLTKHIYKKRFKFFTEIIVYELFTYLENNIIFFYTLRLNID